MPVTEKKKKLVRTIKDILGSSLLALRNNKFDAPVSDYSVVETLKLVHDTARAWGNQYQFCNHELSMSQLDKEINIEIQKYIADYNKIDKKIDSSNYNAKRRALGIHLLCDSKKSPIIT